MQQHYEEEVETQVWLEQKVAPPVQQFPTELGSFVRTSTTVRGMNKQEHRFETYQNCQQISQKYKSYTKVVPRSFPLTPGFIDHPVTTKSKT